MFIIIFATVIGSVMFGKKFKEYLSAKKELDLILNNQKLEKHEFYKPFLIAYIAIVLVGVISIVIGILNKDETTISLGIVVVLLFLGEVVYSPIKYNFYYNKTAFVTQAKKVRYKSIKDIEKIKYIPFAFLKVRTVNGEVHRISAKSYEIIKEYIGKK